LSKSAPSLIVGGFGQVGARLRDALEDRPSVATSTRQREGDTIVLDLGSLREEPDRVEQLFVRGPFAAIFCVGAFTDVESCETRLSHAMAVNRDGPSVLAAAASRRKIPFVYFSSDYVFDGGAGPYAEDDVPNPLSVYGRSKYEGEQAVMAAHPRALIIRTTVVYGPDAERKNFLYALERRLSLREAMQIPDDQISTPTYNRDIALATIALVDRRVTGVVNVSGPEAITRAEFARRAARAMGLDSTGIVPVKTSQLKQRAPRPLRAGLRIDKLARLVPEVPMRSVEAAIADWAPWKGMS